MPKTEQLTKDNVYDYILKTAVENAKKNFPKQVYVDPEPTTGIHLGYPINSFVQDLNTKFVESGLLNPNSRIDPNVKNTAFASAKAIQTIYNLCVADQINRSIDELFEDNEIRNLAGLEFCEELKNQVNERLVGQDDSTLGREFVEDIRSSFDEFADNPRKMDKFLMDSFLYIDQLNKNLLDEGMSPDDALGEAKYRDDVPGGLKEDIISGLRTAIYGYAEGIGQRVNLYIPYDRNTIKPHEFLQHFNEDPNSLTEEERNWARNLFDNIQNQVMAKAALSGTGKGNFVWTDFVVGDREIISEDEVSDVTNGVKDVSDLECKVIASVLSGDDVSLKPEKENGPKLHINPEIICKEPEGFIERIIDRILNWLNNYKDKKAIESMNDAFSQQEKEVDAERIEMTIDDLVGENSFDKVMNQPTNQGSEKTKEHDDFSL